MIKKCIVINGKIINIGEWDYQEIDGDIKNPLPDGAVEEERDFEYNEDKGWYEVGTISLPTQEERIAMLEDTINFLLGL
ncbi:hypothetical protein [Anaerosolibacter sp.]|uniref:hypothetical protein n=1 Tax=Anaerosolibacter sp. TaxID=1872527 RepID=UPI0039F0F385